MTALPFFVGSRASALEWAEALVWICGAVVHGLDEVRDRIAAAARWAGRGAEDVRLVAVSKQQPDERVDAVLAAGHRVFGENRVQEAQRRWEHRRAGYSDLELRLIGPLQTNKARDAVALFDVIETVDREKLAAKIADACAAVGESRRCYVQVNTGGEAQKAGVAPDAADALIAKCRDEYGLVVEGLMAIPPIDAPPAPHFALLAKISERNGLDGLSMGMSADFHIAIELGATSVRVGSAVFGARLPKQ